MIAVLANSVAIIIGVLVGLIFKRFIPKDVAPEIFKAIGLAIIVIGLQKALQTNEVILMVASLSVGSLVGTLINIDKWITNLGDKLEGKVAKKKQTNISLGFVTASILFCSGAMAVFGSLEAGLANDYQTLFSKSVIDGISSIFLTLTLGVGVIFSSIAVFIYQGLITVSSSLIKPFITDVMIHEMSAIGSIMIAAIGFNMIGATKIKIANLLPAILVPIIYYLVLGLLGG